jgi:hypothetical protein
MHSFHHSADESPHAHKGYFKSAFCPSHSRQRTNVPSVYLATGFVWSGGCNWLPSCARICCSTKTDYVSCSPGRFAGEIRSATGQRRQVSVRGSVSQHVWQVRVFPDACSNLRFSVLYFSFTDPGRKEIREKKEKKKKWLPSQGCLTPHPDVPSWQTGT